MKKLAIIIGILVSACVMTSCATKSQPAPAAADTTTAATKHHGHDFKGEG